MSHHDIVDNRQVKLVETVNRVQRGLLTVSRPPLTALAYLPDPGHPGA